MTTNQVQINQEVVVETWFLGEKVKEYKAVVIQVKRNGQFWVSRNGVDRDRLFMPNGQSTKSAATFIRL